MSNIEDRIVRMKFDNAQFEEGVAQTTETLKKFEDTLKLEGASDGLGKVQSAINSVSVSSLTNATQSAGEKFDWLREMAIGALRDIGARIERTAEDMAKKITLQPLIDGFNEYQTQMSSIQTIMANTGRDFNNADQIREVNDALDELNAYADKTIYNFTEMTRNIGTFTAAGISLESAVPAIQGVANLAAVSGSNAEQASRAMYQLSQALSTGTLKLQDWNSVVNAGMGGQVFQDALKRTARAHGIAVDQMIEKAGSFRESLQAGWITSEVLTDTLNQLAISYDEVGDEAYEKAKQTLLDKNYSEEDAKAILELAKTAEEAATMVRTWNQLWETVGEALGSGWTTSWRIIIGDFQQATEVFTYFSRTLGDVINASSNARNALLQDWADNGGRDALFGSIVNLIEAIRRPLAAIVDAFERVFSVTGEDLAIATENFALFTEKLVMSEDAANALGEFFEGLFTILHAGISIIFSLGRAFGKVVGAAWKLIEPFAALLGTKIMEGLDRLVPLFNGVADALDDVTTNTQPLVDLFQTLKDKVVSFFTSLSWFNTVSEFIGNGVNRIKDFFKGTTESADKASEAVQDAELKWKATNLSGFIEELNQVFKETDTLMSGVGLAMEKTAASLPEWLGPFKKGMGDFGGILKESENWSDVFNTIFVENFEQLPGILKPAVTGIQDLQGKFKEFTDYANGIKAIFDESGLLGVLKHFEEQLNNAFKESKLPKYLKPVSDAFSDFIKEFEDSGSIIKAFKKILDNAFKNVKSKVTSTFDELKKKIEEFKGTKPKEAIEGVGKSLSASLVPGLKETADNVPQATTMLQRLAEKGGNALTNFKNTLSGWKTAVAEHLSGALQNLGQFVVNLPLTIAQGIRDFGAGLTEFIQNLKEISAAIKDSGVDVVGAIRDLFPSPSEIGAGLNDKLNELGQWFHDALKGVFMGNNDGAADAMKSNWLDFSDIEIKFPDFKAPVLTFEDDLRDVLENFPWDTIDEFTERFGKFTTWLVKGMWIENLFWFLRSIRSLNKGIGKAGEGAGKALEGIPKILTEGLENIGKNIGTNLGGKIAEAGKNIKEGLENIGRGTKALTQKKDVPTQLMKIAAAIAILAGALWVFMQTMNGHSSQEVMDAIKLLTVLVGAMAAVVIVAGIITDMSNLDGDKMANLGNAFVGLGIGVVAMTAALYALTEYFKRYSPEEQINGIIALVGIAAVVGILALAMQNVDFRGLGLAAIGMAVAITLLLIPIEILGRTNPNVVKMGAGVVGALLLVLGLAIAAAVAFSGGAKSLFALGTCALAFSIAITLLLIPIEILAHTDPYKLSNGLIALGVIMAILELAIILGSYLSGSASNIYAMGAAAIGLAIAVNLLMIPVVVLSLIPEDSLVRAVRNLAVIIAVMGLVVALVAVAASFGEGGAGTLVAMAASFIGLAIAIDLLVVGLVVLSALAALNSGALFNAVVALGAVVVAFVAIEALGTMVGPGIVKLSAAFVIFGVAVAALAVSMLLLEAVNLTGVADQLKYLAAGLAIFAVAAVLLSPVAPAVLMVAGAIALLGVAALAVSAGIYLFAQTLQELGATAPEQISVIGKAVGQGFADALMGFVEELFNVGKNLVGSVLAGIGDFAQGVWDAGKNFIGWLTGGMNDNPDATRNTGEQIKNEVTAGASGTGEAVAAEVGKSPDQIQAIINSKQGALIGAGETIKNSVGKGAAGLTEDLNKKMTEGADSFVAAADSYNFEKVGEDITNKVTEQGLNKFVPNMEDISGKGADEFIKKLSSANYANTGQDIDTSVLSGLSGFVDDMASSGDNGAAGFIAALASPENIQAAYDAGFAVGDASNRGTNDALAIASPSRVMYQSGTYAVQGFVNAFSDNLRNAYGAGSSLAEQIPRGVEDAFNANPIAIEEILDTDYNPVITPVINTAAFDGGFSQLSDMLRFNSSAFSLNGYFDGVDLRGLSDLGTIETSNRELIGEIRSLRSDLQGYTEAASSAGIYMDGDVLVGELAPRMDNALGQRAALAERGVY